jgi:hypothetical protein
METKGSLPSSQQLTSIPSLCVKFHNSFFVFVVRSCQPLAQPPTWSVIPCRLSATAYILNFKNGELVHYQL